MLQQTQVATVIGYFERFIARFPTVEHLARADVNDVLALWSGLGYYSRARHLHAAARAIVEEHGGVIPSDVDGLMSLPGIGRYTAGAIASIAYGRRVPVLDGNVARVLIRVLAIEHDPKSPALREHLWTQAEALLPRSRCGDFNQALMELGATICRPKSPLCGECPIRADCRARELNLADELPWAARRAKVKAAEYVALAIRDGDEFLLVQRPMTGLWAGLWEFPTEPLAESDSTDAALGRLQKRIGIKCLKKVTEVGSTTRVLTHRRITFRVYAGCTPSRCGALSLGVAEASRPQRGGARQPEQSAASSSRECQVQSQDPQPSSTRWFKPGELQTVGISRASLAILSLLNGSSH